MKFITIRELRSKTAQLRRELGADREIVVTANGKPFAIMTAVDADRVEEELLAIRRARAQAALGNMRAKAAKAGLDRMKPAEIDAVIKAARRDRRTGR